MFYNPECKVNYITTFLSMVECRLEGAHANLHRVQEPLTFYLVGFKGLRKKTDCGLKAPTLG